MYIIYKYLPTSHTDCVLCCSDLRYMHLLGQEIFHSRNTHYKIMTVIILFITTATKTIYNRALQRLPEGFIPQIFRSKKQRLKSDTGFLKKSKMSSEVGNFLFDNSNAMNLSIFHGFGVLSEP